MAKMLGTDIVTTEELKAFEAKVIGELKTRLDTAENKVKLFVRLHWGYAISAALVIIYLAVHY